jgi:glycosyltransferase involved in cell wall biosynthesis
MDRDAGETSLFKVCMLTDRFYPDHGGGALQALRLCKELGQRGIGTLVITGHKSDLQIAEDVQGIPVIRLPQPKGEGVPVLPFYGRYLQQLVAHRREYDLIHAHGVHHHAYAGFLAGRLLGKPAIVKLAGLNADTPGCIRRRRLGRLQLGMLSLATRLVVTSHELYERTIAEGVREERVVRIPNGVDTDAFRPVDAPRRRELRQELGIPTQAKVAVFVGAVRPVKGLDVLAEKWPAVQAAVPDLHLYLVGPYRVSEHWALDEAYVERLKHLFQTSAGSKSQVYFVGQTAAVPDYLQSADLFVFPSRSEGMPNALLEAMSCGLPFVATALGCIQEIAPPEQRAFLVPGDDAEALSRAVIKLASDENARHSLGMAARREIQARYSLAAVSERYIELYRNLLGFRQTGQAGNNEESPTP